MLNSDQYISCSSLNFKTGWDEYKKITKSCISTDINELKVDMVLGSQTTLVLGKAVGEWWINIHMLYLEMRYVERRWSRTSVSWVWRTETTLLYISILTEHHWLKIITTVVILTATIVGGWVKDTTIAYYSIISIVVQLKLKTNQSRIFCFVSFSSYFIFQCPCRE